MTENPRSHRPPLLAAYAGERQATPPVWFMRQAGRSLPEYRASRAGTAMLDACLDPALAAEITVQPVRRHAVDAAIFFSDIVVPLKLAGVDVDIVPGRGPVFARPVRTPADLDDLVAHELTPDALAPIEAAVAATVARARRHTAHRLRGRALHARELRGGGRPVEGPAARPHPAARRPGRVAARSPSGSPTSPGRSSRAQVRAGAAAVQLFDSWAGALSEADYRAAVLPASASDARGGGRGCRRCTSAPARRCCCPRCATRART